MHVLNSQEQLFKEIAKVLECDEVNIFDMRSVEELAKQYELTALYMYIKLYGYQYKKLLQSFRRWCDVQSRKRSEHYLKPNRGYRF